MTKHTLIALSLSLLPLAAGCTNQADQVHSTAARPIENPNFQRFDVNLPPKQVLAVAQKVVSSPPYSLPIENVNKGVLTTGWKEYRGAFHIVRYWQERTRYQVSIYPDFDDPAGRASIRVTQETETRASDQGNWFTLLDEDRSDRAAALAKAIQQAAQSQQPPAPAAAQ